MDLKEWKYRRHLARTNLMSLAYDVLKYRDLVDEVHGPMMRNLQRHWGGEEPDEKITLKGCGYTPKYKLEDLPSKRGIRQHLNLFPRGGMKTTVVTIAYAIQWILNYPDVRIFIDTAVGDQGKKIITEIKGHFQFNEVFRWHFPEFCPQGKRISEFGNQDQFTVPNRPYARKEPTVFLISVGAVVSGSHVDVGLHDDVVDKENVRTAEQIQTVKEHLGMTVPLIELYSNGTRGWQGMAGTRYDFSDAYGTIIDAEKEKPVERKQWSIVVQPAVNPDGSHWFPQRLGPKALKDIEEDPLQGPKVLASQYMMSPMPPNSGLVDNENQIIFVPAEAMEQIYARLSLHVTVDLAGMEPASNKMADNDYTVINLHGFGRDGSLYVVNLWRNRFSDPMEVIDLLFQIYKDHPRIVDIKISKDHFFRVLNPFLKREMSKRGKWLPTVPLPIDNRISKQQKIKGLQPWFRNGSLRFADNTNWKLPLLNEILRFPKYAHDDILDTIADAMLNREGEVVSDVIPSEKRPPALPAVPVQAQHISPEEFWGQRQEDEIGVNSITGW